MSGKKYRTISDDEYYRITRRAREAEEARRRAEAEARARAQVENDLRIAKTYNSDLEKRIANLGSRLSAAEADASNTKKELINTVKSTNEALKKQADNFDKKLANTRNAFADAMDRNNRRIEKVIDDNNKEIKKDIDALKRDTQTQLTQVKASISGLARKVGDPQALIDAGNDYLAVALELINELKNSRHAMFFPGEMDRVLAAVKKAKEHIKSAVENPANASNALLTGENAFDAAHKLYQDVAAAEALWASKLAMALEALTVAGAEIEAREKVELEGVELDADHWSNGGLSKLKEQVEKLREILSDEESARKLSIADLEGISALAQDVIDDSEQVMNGAVFAILSSEERANLAADLAEDLADKAGLLIIRREGYEGEDQRAANLIHLKNGTTGFEVVITLKPVFKEGRCGYEAVTEIVDEGDTQEVAAVFDKTLKEIMGDYGLSGNSPISVKPDKEEEIRDWTERETATTVSTVNPDSGIAQGVDKVQSTVRN